MNEKGIKKDWMKGKRNENMKRKKWKKSESEENYMNERTGRKVNGKRQ